MTDCTKGSPSSLRVPISGAKTMSNHTTTPWEQIRDESLAAMTGAERAEYDAVSVEAEARLQLADLVYNARTPAYLHPSSDADGR